MISEKSINLLKNFDLVIFGLSRDLHFRKFFPSLHHRLKEGKIKPKSSTAVAWGWISSISDNWIPSNRKNELYNAELMVLEILFLTSIRLV